jgi:hypothetical protein
MLTALLALGTLLAVPARVRGNCVAIDGVANQKPLEFRRDDRAEISRRALDLLRSATFEAPAAVATRARWEGERRRPHLHLCFAPARTALSRSSTAGPARKQRIRIDEMVVPFERGGASEYLWVKDRNRIRAFAKYVPGRFEALRQAMNRGH